MVRNGEHVESINTKCSSAMKGNIAIFLLQLCISSWESIETSQDLSPDKYLKTVKKTSQTHHFLIKCS